MYKFVSTPPFFLPLQNDYNLFRYNAHNKRMVITRMEAVNIIKGLGLYFYKVAENSQDVFWVRSADFNTHLYVNRAFEYVWKIAVDALYKQPRLWFDCIPVDQQQHILAQLESWVSSPTIDDVYTMEYPILDDDGNETLISDSVCPIFHNGECVGFSGVASIKGGITTPNCTVTRPAISTKSKSVINNENIYATHSYNQTSPKTFQQDSPILTPWSHDIATFLEQNNTLPINGEPRTQNTIKRYSRHDPDHATRQTKTESIRST